MFVFMIIIFSCSHCVTKYLLVETVDEEQGSGIDTGIKIPAKNGKFMGPAAGLSGGPAGVESGQSQESGVKGEDYDSPLVTSDTLNPKLGWPGSATNGLFGNIVGSGSSVTPPGDGSIPPCQYFAGQRFIQSDPPCKPVKVTGEPPSGLWG